MMNKVVVICCSVLLFSLPLSAEAGYGGILNKINGEQIKQTLELIQQTQKMIEQIKSIQQAYEHCDFSDLNSTYNFLNNSMSDVNAILNTTSEMNTTITELEDRWTEAGRDYDSKDVSDEKKAEWKAARESRLKDSKSRSLKLAQFAIDTKKSQVELQNIQRDLRLVEQGKASPIKQGQAVAQLLTHVLRNNKVIQSLMVDKVRTEIQKEEEEMMEKKQNEAIAKNNAQKGEANISVIVQEKASVTYDSGSVPYSANEWLKSQQAYQNESKSKSASSEIKKN